MDIKSWIQSRLLILISFHGHREEPGTYQNFKLKLLMAEDESSFVGLQKHAVKQQLCQDVSAGLEQISAHS